MRYILAIIGFFIMGFATWYIFLPGNQLLGFIMFVGGGFFLFPLLEKVLDKIGM